jgi:hypothetical protein
MTLSCPKRPRASALLVCALLLVVSVGCPKREPARETLDAMRRTTVEQGRVTREVMHVLVALSFAEVEARLRADAAAQRAELRAEIYRRTQFAVDEVAADAVAQLERALEGPVERLQAALRAEQSKPASQRDRAREHELAVQLGSTLALLGRESNRLREKTAERAALARDEALALVETSMAAVQASPELDLDPDALARELLAEFSQASQKYDGDMVAALEQLGRYVDSPQVGVRGLSVGLFGERLGERVAARAGELLARGEAHLANELIAIQGRAQERLDALR